MPEQTTYIWIEDAVKTYRRSRAYLDEQLKAGRLTYAKFEGDRRVYLRRDELDEKFGKPIIEERKRDESAS